MPSACEPIVPPNWAERPGAGRPLRFVLPITGSAGYQLTRARVPHAENQFCVPAVHADDPHHGMCAR
jgi:hypothetical protein